MLPRRFTEEERFVGEAAVRREDARGCTMPQRSDILFICTIAQGGGDVTFASLAAAALALHCTSLSIICVAQASRDPTAAASLLLPLLPPGVPLLACFSRDATNALRAAPLPAHAGAAPPPPPPFSAVLQGPLHLFVGAAEAAAALGVPLRAAPPPAFLCLREFGQGRFLPPSAPPALQHASAGLAEGEWGLWATPAGGAAAAAAAVEACTPAPATSGASFISHFHTEEHGAALGRLVASVLLLAQMEGGGVGGGDAVVAAPAGSRGALLRGLASHPGVARVGEEGARLLLTPAHAPLVALPLRVESAAPPLPRAQFLGALARCDGALVTGDASVNEALALSAASGLPFLYSAAGHKAFFAEALAASLPPLLRRFWAFAEGGGPRAAWEALVGELRGGGEPPLCALRGAYRSWSAALLRERGTLGDRLAAWAAGVAEH